MPLIFNKIYFKLNSEEKIQTYVETYIDFEWYVEVFEKF